MVKNKIYSFQKMNKDIVESKTPQQFYFDAHNIRFLTNEEVITGGFSFEKGNGLVVTVPNVSVNRMLKPSSFNRYNYSITYNDKELIFSSKEIKDIYLTGGLGNKTVTSGQQLIIGHTISRNNIILFTTDNNGFDCIWKINDETYDIELLYLRDLKFNKNNPIQAINNYENEIIDKVYWVDGKSQMRFINIYNKIENGDLENLIDIPSNTTQITSNYDISQPEIIDIAFGGIHTSGMIQYAYNLYKVNSSQTKLSPLSELISLDKGNGNGGGIINEIVGSTPVIKIDNIDQEYTNIKIYSIKYTSFGSQPAISLIVDKRINGATSVTYYDDGNIIESISLEEFIFLGSDIIIPKHINTKNNIMFLANYKEKNFDINNNNSVNSIDLRAFGFQSNTTTTPVYNSLIESGGVIASNEPTLNIVSSTILTGLPMIKHDHSTINKNFDLYNKQYNSTIFGGEGPYLKYKIVRNQIGANGFTQEEADKKFLKDNEVYRLAIQFYNNYGQESLPKWIADFKTIVLNNQSNLNGYYASVEITLKPLFYDWLNNNNNFLDENGVYDDSLKPVGYKLLRAERNILDRTIVCQGIINGMLSQVSGDDTGSSDISPASIIRANNGLKIPSMMRRFDEYLAPMWRNKKYFRVDRFNGYHPNFKIISVGGEHIGNPNEVFKDTESAKWTAGTYQFTQLMQMFSPEITFNVLQNIGNVKLNVIGGIENDYNATWVQTRSVETKVVEDEGKFFNSIYPLDVKSFDPGNSEAISGNIAELQSHGFFGHTYGEKMNFVQTYRSYKGNFIKNLATFGFDIYGNPEVSETGQGSKTYNNDSELRYSNSLQPLAADSVLTSVNSWGAKNITFALGDKNTDTEDRISLEDLHTASIPSSSTNSGVGLIGEFRIPKNLIYVGNIYGGNSYESKKRSNYIEIGKYNNIENNIYNCINAGDTFIQNFKFTKLVKTETEIYSKKSEQVTEIVEFRVETSVDLENRSDLSLTDWDNRFQPQYNEYQDYNKVYSQESNLLIRRDADYKFKRINSFDTKVISTKIKLSGELIDSWTDLQPNNVITLDGKQGQINNLISWRDELYTYQDKGIAKLSIQPRVQVQGSDGISVELGTGSVLADYSYITTNSGSINKWGIISIENGMYYIDALNKTFNSISNEGLKGISDMEGFHKYFIDEIDLPSIKIDNPLINSGASIGWDKVTNDIYISLFKDENNIKTISYNIAQNGFSSEYDYNSGIYIYTKGKTHTINPFSKNKIYRNFIGNYNIFYEQNKKSSISFVLNPESNVECTFNNLEFKSEAFNNSNQEQRYSWERIRAYNDFQDSGLINLVQNKNIRQLNRKWRLNIPRDNNKINRIRNTWCIIHLESNNNNNYKFRNNDIISYYNPNYKMIQ